MARRRFAASTARPAAIKMPYVKVDFADLALGHDIVQDSNPAGFDLIWAWYDKNQALLSRKHKVDGMTDEKRMKTYQKAQKARSLGAGAATAHEAETAYTMALKLYEKLWKVPASINATVTARNEGKPASKRATVLNGSLKLLNDVYTETGFSFSLANEESLEGRKIGVPVAGLEAFAAAPLASILRYAVTVAKAQSVVVDPVNGPRIDAAGFIQTHMPNILDRIATWAQYGANVVALKPQAVPAARKSQQAPRAASAPRTHRPSGPGVGVAGYKMYQAGSANAAVFTLLSDGNIHTFQECCDASAATGAKYPKDALWFVTSDGKKTGAWQVLVAGREYIKGKLKPSSYRMEILK